MIFVAFCKGGGGRKKVNQNKTWGDYKTSRATAAYSQQFFDAAADPREHDFGPRSTAALPPRQCCAVKLCAHITQVNEGRETAAWVRDVGV